MYANSLGQAGFDVPCLYTSTKVKKEITQRWKMDKFINILFLANLFVSSY